VLTSPRLRYRRVEPALLDDFHRLVTDPHVLRYMMDGEVHTRDWSAERIAESEALFVERGVGLWLAYDGDDPLGFCGFIQSFSLHPEPELVYALLPRHAGRGLATEMARACIAAARRLPGFGVIHAAVDGVNVASARVLEKLGFQRHGAQPGAFGEVVLLRLPAVVRLDHVQLAMPAGREGEARAFYQGLLGLPERPKPADKAGRGGVWFESDAVKVHLGVDPDFHPARKAHPALVLDDLPAALARLRAGGVEVREGDGVYVSDPFGNRIELLLQGPASIDGEVTPVPPQSK
jgi:RimJ/RimL family protein N-acetyltransferase/catechol 2,3-dioxygenase-like lactoylglutathione lyase family enzyme